MKINTEYFINNVSELDTFKFKGNNPTVLKFEADWCGPCKIIKPVYEELEKEYQQIKFLSINVDEENKIANLFDINSIPTVILISSDGSYKSIIGSAPKQSIVKAFKEKFKIE